VARKWVDFLGPFPNKKIFTDAIRTLSATAATNMRFVQYRLKKGGLPHLGGQIAPEGDIFDISNVDHSIPNTLTKFLATGDDVYERAKR
jgi:hypothetical protein